MTHEKERRDFEAECKRLELPLACDYDDDASQWYTDERTAIAWLFWQARAALDRGDLRR